MHQSSNAFTGQPSSSSMLPQIPSSSSPSPSPSPLQYSSQSQSQPQYPYGHSSFHHQVNISNHTVGSMDMSHFHQPSLSPSHPPGCHFQNPSTPTAPPLIAPSVAPNCVPPPMMPPKTPNSPEAIQALLEENKDLLTAALEYQNIGRVVESAQ